MRAGVCVCEYCCACESIALTVQRVTSITKEHPPPSHSLIRVRFIIGGSDEPGGKCTDAIGPRYHVHTHRLARFPHTSTHQTFDGICVSSLVAKEIGFSLASRSVNLQHVAMATGNLLKGLTSLSDSILLVWERKAFVWRCLLDLNKSKRVRVCCESQRCV